MTRRPVPSSKFKSKKTCRFGLGFAGSISVIPYRLVLPKYNVESNPEDYESDEYEDDEELEWDEGDDDDDEYDEDDDDEDDDR